MLRALVAARKSRGWSHVDFGKRVGLPQVHVSHIETGKVTPRFNTLLDWVRVLDFDLLLVPRQLVPVVQSLAADTGERSLYAADDSGDRHES